MRRSPMHVLNSSIFAVSLALGGCGGAPDASSRDRDETSSSESALRRGGSSLGYDCAGQYCTCTGDPDCNDMFSDGVCGPSAICQINPYDVPRCRCSVALRTYSGARDADGTVTLSVP